MEQFDEITHAGLTETAFILETVDGKKIVVNRKTFEYFARQVAKTFDYKFEKRPCGGCNKSG